jgi:hypothetical protein
MSLFQQYNLKLHQKSAIIAFCIFLCFILGQFLNAIISQALAPDIFKEMSSLTKADVAQINVLKLLQFVSALFSFVVPALVIAFVFNKSGMPLLNLKKSPPAWYYLLVPVFMFSLMPLMNIIIQWNESLSLPQSMNGLELKMKSMEESSQSLVKLMISGTTGLDLFVNILFVGMLPALGEELLFRGVIQKHLGEWVKNPHISIFLAAFIFSFIHFQFYGFVPRLMLGMIFGYLVYFSGSLWPAIFAHFFNNTMAVIAMHFTNTGALSTDANSFGTQTGDIYFVIFGLVLALASGFILFRKKIV